MVRRRRLNRRGFTLTELMVVVAIVGIVAALAVRMYSRGVSGELAPGFARSLMSTMLEARHSALALGRPTKVALTPGSPVGRVVSSAWDPINGWQTQMTLALPSSVQLCTPDNLVKLGNVTPTCPLTAVSLVCFAANGRVTVPSGSNDCPAVSPSTGTGATVYVRSTNGDKKYRLVIWGLTGMVKLIDRW